MLAQIDPRSFQALAGQAEGALARDSAQLENARQDLQRYQGLLAKDAIARQQVENQAALVRQLEGAVKSDRSALDNALLQLSYTRVVAPTAGRVGLRQADIGNLVQPADPNGIVAVAQTRPINVVFALPSSQLQPLQARLRQKTPVSVQAWDKGSGSVLSVGHVLTIDNAIDVSTDTIKVKAQFANAEDALFPNQSINVRLQLDLLPHVLTVPQAAVLRGAPGFYVYVVAGDGRVVVRPVKPGPVDGDWMAVEGALNAGDRVVVDGVDRLRDGAKVEVIAPAERGASAPRDRRPRGGASDSTTMGTNGKASGTAR